MTDVCVGQVQMRAHLYVTAVHHTIKEHGTTRVRKSQVSAATESSEAGCNVESRPGSRSASTSGERQRHNNGLVRWRSRNIVNTFLCCRLTPFIAVFLKLKDIHQNGCVSSKVHLASVTPTAPSGRYANFKRWIGRKRRALCKTTVCLTGVQPFKASETGCRSPSSTSSWSTNLSDHLGEEWRANTSAPETGNAQCATRIIRRGHTETPVDQDCACVTNSRGLARTSCNHHRDNIQLLRDIMTLSGNAVGEEEAEHLLDQIKTQVERMLPSKLEKRKDNEAGEEMDLEGILNIQSITPVASTPALTPLSGRKSRFQEMKDVCREIFQEDEETDNEEWQEEVIDIDETAEMSEEELEDGEEPKYANSTEELEATINAIFKRWNLSMPDDQGEFSKIDETIRSSISRAASARPKTAAIRKVTPQVLEPPTTTEAASKPSQEKLERPRAARWPRTPSTKCGPENEGPSSFYKY
ncbi:uncharacterized protein [Apostichopus japonicus]|uniref:uncharacterized protein n=1 Tax=Stichopus japonicus TaxID=307972 RepID=UPI003AB6108D